MNAKKIIGIVSNIISLILYIPLCLYFSFLGLMFLSLTEPPLSIPQFLLLAAGGIWLCTPIFCIVGLVLSVIFRKKNRYAYSYIIQLLPFLTVLSAILLMALSMILGNS